MRIASLKTWQVAKNGILLHIRNKMNSTRRRSMLRQSGKIQLESPTKFSNHEGASYEGTSSGRDGKFESLEEGIRPSRFCAGIILINN
mmetsp:Transcript_117942/g.234960  ORF Transcript_117942/g.234960 Transcript_117942/m.234960 type:complete len:88 (-) Transcript_117942:19-282(-)